MKKNISLSILLLLVALCGMAQPKGNNRKQRPNTTSPEVHVNNQVTFRYLAPNAKDVKLNGLTAQPLDMVKNEDGVWSVTTGPIEPNIYPYSFLIDGISVLDPGNSEIFPNEYVKSSLLDIPSQPASVQDVQNVPHGKVTYALYHSNSLDLERPLLIYTPPCYGKDRTKKYPVLYLIHGMTDTHETWYKAGRMNHILDNLIAQGKAEPMIVVMPYANAYPALKKKGSNIQANLMSTDMFTNELLKEIIPYVQANYQTNTERESRAVAGFSLGGRQTLGAGLKHPELFAYVCPMAPAVFPQRLAESFKKEYASPEQLRTLKLLWIGCGKEDGLYAGAKAMAEELDKNNVPCETFYTSGGHNWTNCRIFLTTIVPKLFK